MRRLHRLQVKKNVYKNRIRLNEFFRDFDKVRRSRTWGPLRARTRLFVSCLGSSRLVYLCQSRMPSPVCRKPCAWAWPGHMLGDDAPPRPHLSRTRRAPCDSRRNHDIDLQRSGFMLSLLARPCRPPGMRAGLCRALWPPRGSQRPRRPRRSAPRAFWMQLRVGDITPTQFLAGLNMAGLNKALSTDELQRCARGGPAHRLLACSIHYVHLHRPLRRAAPPGVADTKHGSTPPSVRHVCRPSPVPRRLAEAYTFDKTDSLKMVNYRSFCKDVDTVFTVANLEKTPLAEVPAEPEELLDKTRYQRSSR